MPRKPFLNIPRKEIACALARAGVSGRWIAGYLGCDESTLRYALAHDESFRLRYNQARAEMIIDKFATINRAAEKSWRAAKWFVEQTFKECGGRGPRHSDEDQPDLTDLDENEINPFGPEILASTDESANPNKTAAQARESAANDSPPADAAPIQPESEPKMNLASFNPEDQFFHLTQRGIIRVPVFREPAYYPPMQPPDPSAEGACCPVGPQWPSHTPKPADIVWPPKPYNPIREKIIREGLTGEALDKLLREVEAKEKLHRPNPSFNRDP